MLFNIPRIRGVEPLLKCQKNMASKYSPHVRG